MDILHEHLIFAVSLLLVCLIIVWFPPNRYVLNLHGSGDDKIIILIYIVIPHSKTALQVYYILEILHTNAVIL